MWGPNENLLQKSVVRKEGEALSSHQSVMLIYFLLLREVRGKIEICVLHSVLYHVCLTVYNSASWILKLPSSSKGFVISVYIMFI